MPDTILFIHRGGPQVRGSEEALLTLLKGLDRQLFRPIVLYTDRAMEEPLAQLGIEGALQPLPEIMLSATQRTFPFRRFLAELKSLRRLCRRERVSAILCNGGHPCQLGVLTGRLERIPVVCLFHHPATKYYHLFWLTWATDRNIFVSRFTADSTPGPVQKRGTVMYVGVDADRRFTPAIPRDASWRRRYGYDDSHIVFAQVGALVPYKGHVDLFHAFADVAARLPEARLLVVGGGAEKQRLEQLRDQLGLGDRIQLTGFVDDVVSHYRHVIDVNVLASREEGLGLVTVEAGACGVPTIASDSTGIVEALLHRETGLLFKTGDAASLATAMLELGRDADLRRRLGARAREFALERFSVRSFHRSMQDLLLSCARDRRHA